MEEEIAEEEITEEEMGFDSFSNSECSETGHSSNFEDSEDSEALQDNSTRLLEYLEETEKYVNHITRSDMLMDMFVSVIDPHYEEISALFTDGSPFFIDGDALLLMIMADKQWNNQLRGSSLHIIYLVESYLNIFIDRGAVFHFIFFNSWKSIWASNCTILLYREILINHFSRFTDYEVHVINHCFDEEFTNLFSNIRPHFILCNLDIAIHCSEYIVSPHNARKMLLTQIVQCLNIELCCVDCNHITTEVFNVYAFNVSGSTRRTFMPKSFKFFVESCVPNPDSITEWDYTTELDLLIKKNILDIRKLITVLTAERFYWITENKNFLKLFLLNAAIMDSLNLENRSCPLFTESQDLLQLDCYVSSWHKCLYKVLSSFTNLSCEKIKWTSISDIWQGLLFGHLCRFVCSEIALPCKLGVSIATKYEELISLLSLFDVDIKAYPISGLCLDMTWEEIHVPANLLGKADLLYIKNPLVHEFCGDVLHNIRWTDPPLHLNQTFYTEEHHYHSMKVIKEEFDHIHNTLSEKPTNKYDERRYLHLKYQHAKYMTIYGSSIEGRVLTTESIVREKNEKKNSKKNKKESKISQKGQAIIEKNRNKKLQEQEAKERNLLDDFEKEYKKNKKDNESLLSAINLLINKVRIPSVLLEMYIWKIKILFQIYKNKNVELESNTVLKKDLFLSIRKSLSFINTDLQLKNSQKKLLSNILTEINCCEIAKRNNLTLPDEELNINDNWIRYQLEHLGPELERICDGVPDHRAKGFIPDEWQRQLFNIVDKKESALIVAPTSSGKTFASYYCMERVLKEGDDGIVVYVSPTKALVNQVAATVYARFKNTIMPNGQSVYGIFTRDYRTYATECQILVTVPECLEILLLSPRQYSWSKRLKYVIFDEVHCIAGNIGGVSWERCLTMISCPFLALSATVRNPEEFHGWLQQVENYKKNRDQIIGKEIVRKSYRTHLVIHSERHSDLTKYTYSNEELQHLHPYIYLEEQVMRIYKQIPNHMILSPSETLELYEAMNKTNPSLVNFGLDLYSFFSSRCEKGFITRNVVRKYELELSGLLTTWYRENKTNFYNTIQCLKSKQSLCNGITGIKNIRYIMNNFIKLVSVLKEQNMFPAIIFCYDRHLINYMMHKLTEDLMKNDVIVDRRTEKKNDKMEKIKKKEEERSQEEEKTNAVLKQIRPELHILKNNVNSLREELNQKGEKSDAVLVAYNPKKEKKRQIIPELNILMSNVNSLRDVGSADINVIKYIEKRLFLMNLKSSRKLRKSHDLFIQGLRHGVSMHHSGMDSKWRSAVEMLFRMRVLNVVFATGTLALGIHMPCKTTVIAGNSVFLNSLEYHQMSGRAGRRGFDTAGNVVFFGINKHKQHTLLTGQLPIMQGTFPINISFVLKLMLLVSDVTYRGKKCEKATKVTVSKILTLLENCLVYKYKPKIKVQIKHFFTFALQFLIMEEYINGDGIPLKWCGMATHLHYHEPGNLAFIYLLRTGVIRELCTQDSSDDEIHYQLVLILCYLFTNKPIKTYKEKFKNSKVILEPLPGFVADALMRYNERVNFVFNQYFSNIARCTSERDNNLPLSNIEINVNQQIDESEGQTDSLYYQFLNMCTPTIICSPFAALTGNNDGSNLYSKQKLINNIKRSVCSDVRIVPTLEIRAKLNAYALDFYRHGIIKAIREDNRLKSGEEYTALKDFMLIIKTIRTSLEEMQIVDENDPVFRHFDKLSRKYRELFEKANF